MIDFHSHILPKMDDGSQSMEMTADLCRELSRQGVDTVAATSHFYPWNESSGEYLRRRNAAYRAARASGAFGQLRVLPGAEVAYWSGICQDGNLPWLCLHGTRTLLLELPFQNWPRSLEEDITRLWLDMDYRVVIAHPERYLGIRGARPVLERLLKMPIGFQVNADSLLHLLSRRDALSLLEQARYPLLGSDTHDLTRRPPHMDQARRVLEKKMGAGFLRRLDSSMESCLAATGGEG